MKQHSEKFLKNRKFFLVLPVLVVPFLTIAFWTIGGGKGAQKLNISASQGLNQKLTGVLDRKVISKALA